MTITIRGADYQENLDNDMGLEFYDLSHRWGLGQPCWPYFEDVKIERLHSMAKSGVLTQRITTVMHSGTHIDAPGHVVEGTAFMDEVPLPHFFGTGVVVSIPKERWEVITADDLENATPRIREGDVVIVNTGWHKHYGDNQTYYAYSPGFYKEAGEVVRTQESQDGGHRHASPRPSLGYCNCAPRTGLASRTDASHRSRVRAGDRPQGSGRLPRVGALPPCHPLPRAFAVSRMSAVKSTRSPACGSRSRPSRGVGRKATAALSGSSR